LFSLLVFVFLVCFTGVGGEDRCLVVTDHILGKHPTEELSAWSRFCASVELGGVLEAGDVADVAKAFASQFRYVSQIFLPLFLIDVGLVVK
jgi:hypothetical protein